MANLVYMWEGTSGNQGREPLSKKHRPDGEINLQQCSGDVSEDDLNFFCTIKSSSSDLS
jgi:hypothetical protein